MNFVSVYRKATGHNVTTFSKIDTCNALFPQPLSLRCPYTVVVAYVFAPLPPQGLTVLRLLLVRPIL